MKSQTVKFHLNEVLKDAVLDRNLELIDLLLAHGADPNYVDSTDLDIPILSIAVINKCISIVGALISAGADPNLRDALGRSAMTYAAASGDPSIVKMLILAKASILVCDRQGYSPKRVAVYRGNREVLRYL